MATISIADFCAAIYCALAPDDAIPQRAPGSLVVDAAVHYDGKIQQLRMEFDGISEFSRRSEVPRPSQERGLMEFTAVSLEGTPGSWQFWVNPWSLEEIEFRCTRIRLNGLEVIGTGKHLQDWLPDSTPLLPAIERGAV